MYQQQFIRKGQPFEGEISREGTEAWRTMQSQQSGMPKRVLLLIGEDDEVYKDVVERTLAYSTLTVVTTWQAALKMLHDEKFDLVLVDIKRRREDFGPLDLKRWIRSDYTHVNLETPFIGFLEAPSKFRAEEALAAGYANVIQKPFTSGMLRSTIQQYFPLWTDFPPIGRVTT